MKKKKGKRKKGTQCHELESVVQISLAIPRINGRLVFREGCVQFIVISFLLLLSVLTRARDTSNFSPSPCVSTIAKV